jgi:hypothetical protein
VGKKYERTKHDKKAPMNELMKLHNPIAEFEKPESNRKQVVRKHHE